MKITFTERLLLATGVLLLCAWGGLRLYGTVAARSAVARFKAQNPATAAAQFSSLPDPALGQRVDFRLWSSERIEGYKASLAQKRDAPLAVLRVAKIDLEVPVFDGTDEITLNRGVGWIPGTARPGHPGNVGIAGHRDGFFRGLKDVAPGDLMELDIPGRAQQYLISRIQIVNPEDTYVLRPTPSPALTLVTCFPFYFVGSAPQRFVVQAALEKQEQRGAQNSAFPARQNNKEEIP